MGSGATRFAPDRRRGGLRKARGTLLGLALALVAPAALAAPPARAPKEAPSPDKARAAELFQKSAGAYLKGDFERAITLLDEAYALDPQPVLVYNLARAHEGLGHLDESIALYEKYLAQDPTSADRGAIEQRLSTLKRQRDEKAALAKEKQAVEKEREQVEKERAKQDAEDPPRPRSILPYVVGGVGVASVVTGAVFGAMASGKESDAQAEPVQTAAIDLRDTGKGFATISNITIIAGGALVAAGVVWWILDTPKSKRRGGLAPRVGLAPGFVSIGGELP
ncbi:MAG: tetratricopeptide repeat protein [Deltaproteobacteria bacterium]|nr:tetratricopeptide repeat protein [Deltaproteobacteria bacterium]